MIKMDAKLICFFQVAVLVCFISSVARANDTATEITPAGLIFKTIDSVSIEKEDLKISREKIEVFYAFRNNSDKDIVTDVAFPIPNYDYVEMNVTANPAFEDFTVFADGVRIQYEVVARALLNGKDYTELLAKKGITIHNFGGSQASILNKIGQDKDNFMRLGLIEADGQPNWTVSKSYVWRQKFPKNSIVKITHSYTPCYGFDQFYSNPGYLEALPVFVRNSCVAGKEAATIMNGYTNKNRLVRDTVTYILKTANNWKKSIKEFKIQIEKKSDEFIGICFDGKANAVSPLRFEATLMNYSPSSDLEVHWIRKLTDK